MQQPSERRLTGPKTLKVKGCKCTRQQSLRQTTVTDDRLELRSLQPEKKKNHINRRLQATSYGQKKK